MNHASHSPAAALAQSRGGSGRAPPLLDQPLARFVTREPVSCAPVTPIGEVLETLRREVIGTMVVVDGERRPLGVFTLRDVLDRVALADVDRAQPVATVMATKIHMLPSHAQGFEAALLMAREGIRYVLIVDGGHLVGVVSESRLFSVWRGGIGDVSAIIRAAQDVDQMVAATAKIHALVDGLLDERAPAESVTGIITSLNDLVTQRLLEMLGCTQALAEVGGCWIALGSQGRREQTLATDQDNAIIFADEGDADSHRRELLPLARAVNAALDRCGYPLCRGDIMASNPMWCLSLAEWRERFARWIDVPDPRALLNATIFFDLREIEGDRATAAALQTWLSQYARDRGGFLLPMAANALASAPPLGLLRDFILSRGGDNSGTLDLKINGVQLFVESARIYSLATGTTATNTLDRIAQLGATHRIPPDSLAAWADAFRYIQLLRLRLNASQRRSGASLHNHLDPQTLNGLDRRFLKESLRQARGLQSRLARDFSVSGPSFGA